MIRHQTKLFKNGLAQAVRIPLEYRFNCNTVSIFQNLLNGDVVISANPDSWEDYFSVLQCHGLVDESAVAGRQEARLFLSGGSQAVRIPSVFEFDCDSVYLFQEKMTGDVILSKKPDGWGDFFRLVDRLHIPDDVLFERDDRPPPVRDGF